MMARTSERWIWFAVLLILVLFFAGGIAPSSAAPSDDHQLIAGCDEQFPPYQYIDLNGQPDGFSIDIMNAVAEEMSLPVSIRPATWGEVRSDLESGDIDFACGMFYSEERDEVLNFSQSYLTHSHSIFVGEGSDIRGPEDLKGKEIVVEDGDIMHDYALGLDSSNTIVPVVNQYEALRLVASGTSDAALISKLHGAYLINTYGLTGVSATGPPLETREFCIAASANASKYLPAINEGLAIIKKNGRYDEIYDKWFGVYEEQEFLANLLKIVVFVLLPVIILLAAALAWSVSLRKKLAGTSAKLVDELAEQKRMKAKLQESRDKYQVLFHSLNESVFLCEYGGGQKAGRIIEVNDTACRRLGYTRDELMGFRIPDIFGGDSHDFNAVLERLATEEEISYPAEHVKKSGTVFPVYVKTRLLTLGGKEYVLQLARDITKERESHRIETDALKKIEENLIQLATLNDEIRNPLMVITGVTDLELEDAKGIILDQVNHINDLVKRLDQGWVESSKIREFLRKHLEMYGEWEEQDASEDEV